MFKKERAYKIFRVVILAIAILSVMALLFLNFFPKKEKSTVDDAAKNNIVKEKKEKGTLFLSLKPGENNAVESVYMYNLVDGKLRFVSDKNNINTGGQGLPSGIAVTSSLALDQRGTERDNIFQLYQINLKNISEHKQITKSPTFLKRHPELSPDGKKVAFMARKELGNNQKSSISDWSVFVSDMDGNEKLIGTGAVYPQWSPDSSKLVILKSDGIYLYDFNKQEEEAWTKIWKMQKGVAYLGMSLDVSRDGSMLAWSVPNNRQTILMKITSWDPLKIEIYKTIENTLGFWPVFSPEEKYLAIIAADRDEKGNITKPNLRIYNLETFESQDVLDLGSFYTTTMTLTDWGYNLNIE